MRQTRRPAGEIAVALLFAVLLGVLFGLKSLDVAVPDQLRSVEGNIISRTPIYSKNELTGFRFCFDSPRLTFTYSDDEPRFKEAWSAINSNSAARVVYAEHHKRNPTLWALDVNGKRLTDSKELGRARLRHALLYLVGCLLSICFAYWAWQAPRKPKAVR